MKAMFYHRKFIFNISYCTPSIQEASVLGKAFSVAHRIYTHFQLSRVPIIVGFVKCTIKYLIIFIFKKFKFK